MMAKYTYKLVALLSFGFLIQTTSANAQTSSASEVKASIPAAEKPPLRDDPNVITLLFLYGTEKAKWITAVTEPFNKSKQRLASGEVIYVKAVGKKGSGELTDDVYQGRQHAHLISPAAGVFIDRANALSREKVGKELVGETKRLVRSPIVVAMWREMAEAIGWPGRSLRWAEIFAYAQDETLWRSVTPRKGEPFRFGHTHPEYSNTGLHALFLETYSALRKFKDVSRSDVAVSLDVVGGYIQGVEGTIDRYGESTGTLGKEMWTNDPFADPKPPTFLTAAILYENLVIEANKALALKNPEAQRPRIVAIYPAEGTFPSEHPVGIVDRDWVTAKHREAAGIYIDYLRARPQQELAISEGGFRPAEDGEIPLGEILKPEYGVDPNPNFRELAPPKASAISLILEVWRMRKRKTEIVLAIDTSKSMDMAVSKTSSRMKEASEAASEFIDTLGPGDNLSTMIFGTDVEWLNQGTPMSKESKDDAKKTIEQLIPDGDTPLYEAIETGTDFLAEREAQDPSRSRALVVLSDGEDTRRKTIDGVSPLARHVANLQKTKGKKSGRVIPVFIIRYGEANEKAMQEISDATGGRYYDINDRKNFSNLREIFRNIATLF